MIANLDFTKELGISSKKALEEGNLKEFANLMNVHWENKKKRSSNMSKSAIDNAYEVARENGALGGKLIGAGAGGFLMFYTKATRSIKIRHELTSNLKKFASNTTLKARRLFQREKTHFCLRCRTWNRSGYCS